MRLLLALLLPPVVFFTIGRPWQGLFCLILQLTLIGWIPAAIWAVYALSQYRTEQMIADSVRDRE
ncbi:YqaE/Pmp3 family membrane protein [Tropicibacter sp. R16_0]|nr:YqaE/Pmp3 family membrane protein [Tropicibacter sp. R16_0]MBO9451489.1 YqaE/Pmp3 family membrane protein [Tropicibacter sp. R16_0]